MRRSVTLVLALLTSFAAGVLIYAIQPDPASPQARSDGPVDDLPEFATGAIVSTENRVTFLQATPDGLRDVTIVWARGAAPRPAVDDREVTTADGRRFVVQRLAIALEPARAGYRIAFDFVIPAAAVPGSDAAWRHDPADSLLGGALRTIADSLSATLSAAEGESFSGSFTDVRTVIRQPGQKGQGVREAALERMRANNRPMGGYCTAFETREAREWIRKMNEVNRQLSELGEGGLQQSQPAYGELVAQRDALMAQDRAARSRIAQDVAAHRRSERGSMGAEGAGAAMEKMMIDAETAAFKERLAALRRCHQNPTNPLAQKAKNEDPAYQKVEDALDAVEMEINGLSKMRGAASGINAAAAVGLSTAGGAMAGVLGQIEDAMLKQLIEEALASIEKCVVKCECGANMPPANVTRPATPGGAELNYTPGPDQLFTPGPASPQPPPNTPAGSSGVCKPPTHVDVTYREYLIHPGGARVSETNWTGGADLRYVPEDEGWEGQGTIRYQFHERLRIPGTALCPAGETSTTIGAGRPSFIVRVQPTIDQGITGGNDTSGMPVDTAVVEIITGSGPTDRIEEQTEGQVCGQDRSRSDSLTGPGTECHFYITAKPIAGVYTVDAGHGKCTLSIY